MILRRAAVPMLLLSLAAVLAGCGRTSFLITPVPAQRGLHEFEFQRDSIWAGDKVALVDLDGLITNSNTSIGLLGGMRENPVVRFKEQLDAARRDDQVKAVVLRINSPGGGVTASDLMHTELVRFKQRCGKPVIVSMLDVCASGGYYIASAADRLFAHPTTVTGSIGVIMTTPEFSGLMTKLGVRANVIKSGPLKDAGSPFRPMSDADRAEFQSLVDRMYARFVDVVAAGREPLNVEQVRALADGRVMLGPEAQAAGLVDEVGTLPDAIAAAKHAAGLDDRDVVLVQYGRVFEHKPNIYAQAEQPVQVPAGSGAAEVNVINVDLPSVFGGAQPQFLYLWAPGL